MQKKTRKRKAQAAPDVASTSELVLGTHLGMREARELKQRSMELLSAGRPCVIDAWRVERVSTGCLQILASFASSMAAAGHNVTVSGSSNALLEGFQMLGLSEQFAQFHREY